MLRRAFSFPVGQQYPPPRQRILLRSGRSGLSLDPFGICIGGVDDDQLPLPEGEGWGEGLRSIVRPKPLTRRCAPTSPPGRGGTSHAARLSTAQSNRLGV